MSEAVSYAQPTKLSYQTPFGATGIRVVFGARPRHLRGLRTALRGHRDALAAALRRHLGSNCLPALPTGGLHLWCALPDGVSDIEVEQRAAARGILVSAGRHWYPAEPAGPFLRLSFAAAQPDWVQDCVAELAEVIHSVAP